MPGSHLKSSQFEHSSAGTGPPQTIRPRALLATLALVGSLLNCAAPVVPCLAPGHCSKGEECLAQRCVTLGAEPVPQGSARTVVEASRVLVVTPDGVGALPPTVTLGSAPARDRALVLSFPQLWASRDVDAAFLLLEPAIEADPTAGDVVVRAALAAGEWAAGSAPRGPSERAPSSTGLGRSRPPSLLRLDVTAQLRASSAHDGDLGFVLSAENALSHGATFLTGARGGTPRLDVYSRPRAKKIQGERQIRD
jgi:hypothetical protein